MGRHAAYKPGYSTRANNVFQGWLEKHNLRLPKLPTIPKRKLRPTEAFLSVLGLLLVSVVDPYAGSYVYASSLDFSVSNAPTNQAFDVINPTQVSFARGGFTVVSTSSNLFVADAGIPDPGTAKAFAFKLAQQLGWGQDQYSCLVKLWERESNWRVNAENPSSGAYGIPQSLPGSKMASEGNDWKTNPQTQIRWGVKYIQGRYKTPCTALVHSDSLGWY